MFFQLKIKFYLEPLLICYSEIVTEHLATGHGFFEKKNNIAEAYLKFLNACRKNYIGFPSSYMKWLK